MMYLFAKMLVMKMYIAKDTRVKWADFATLQRIRHVLFKAVQDKILERLENFHQHLHADQKTLKDVTLSKKVRNTNKTNDKYIFNVVYIFNMRYHSLPFVEVFIFYSRL